MTGTENNTPKNEEKPEPEQLFQVKSETKPRFKEFPSVIERYYTPMYCTNVKGREIDHHCVLFHSNRVCLLTIARSHPIITEKKTVSRINYVTNNVDRKQNKVTGKGKKGAQKLFPDTVLCTVECSDDTSYKIYSCIPGKLVEMNENLFEKPNLLQEKPYSHGHIAVFISDLNKIEECKKQMLDENAYKQMLDEDKGYKKEVEEKKCNNT